MSSDLLIRDARSVWHPFTQVQTELQPLAINHASGAILHTADGRKIIDAIASWWAVLHGHGEPSIVSAISSQLALLQHTIFAGCTHKPAIELAELLLARLPGQSRIFYSDNGSTAVCVGLKMALQFFYNSKRPRHTIVAFEGAYHGDTFEAMALSARGVFSAPFEKFLFEVKRIPLPLPGKEKEAIAAMKSHCANKDVALFIYEPLLLGVCGMVMYAPEPLDELLKIARSAGALCFADEVLTGFGRTGTLFACDQLAEKPDIVALSKALTGGTLPLGVTAASEEIFEAFKGEEKAKALLHGHTYSGNPLACAAALANLKLCMQPEFAAAIERLARAHKDFTQMLPADICRTIGTVLAVEVGESSNYANPLRDKMYRFFLEHDVLLRPMGNVVYTIPPLRITDAELGQIYEVITDCLARAKGSKL